jgi:UDP-N-acetylmuramoyl-tripeptide--D-alanyl-D-alanine ligase
VIPLTLAEVAAAVGGRLVGGADPAAVVTGSVEYDSRRVPPGGLFVALRGERDDGHRFAARAVAGGAVAVLADRDVGVPAVVTDDTLAGLGRLARAVVDRLTDPARSAAGGAPATVVGITGSAGKTSTKDLTAQLLGRLGTTLAPEGTLNNEMGLPYTALRADRDTRHLVLEYSTRAIGDIRYLCEVAPPRLAVELNVGHAHLGEFGSRDAIAVAKGELVEALPPDGVAVLNADDHRVRAMADRTKARVVLVGTAADADVRAADVTLDAAGRPSFTLVTPAGKAAVALGLHGGHQVGNALSAAAVALELGLPPDELPAALAHLRPVSARRMDVFERPDGVTVVDDSYNANPGSMLAALRALVTMGERRRTWAVLGYMAELGEFERDEHERLGAQAVDLGVDRIVAVADEAAGIHQGALARAAGTQWGGRSVQVPDQSAAIALLADELRPGDVVLVKGSRYRTWQVADALRPAGDA